MAVNVSKEQETFTAVDPFQGLDKPQLTPEPAKEEAGNDDVDWGAQFEEVKSAAAKEEKSEEGDWAGFEEAAESAPKEEAPADDFGDFDSFAQPASSGKTVEEEPTPEIASEPTPEVAMEKAVSEKSDDFGDFGDFGDTEEKKVEAPVPDDKADDWTGFEEEEGTSKP